MSDKLQTLNVNGTEYETFVPARRVRAARANDQRQLRAFIPGVITEVLVSDGQAVKEGANLLAIEAMKMENSVRAALGGTVKRVHVRPGEVVVKDQLLVELE